MKRMLLMVTVMLAMLATFVGTANAAHNCILTPEVIASMGYEDRWEYYAVCPLPDPPEGHQWAADLTLVDNPFYG